MKCNKEITLIVLTVITDDWYAIWHYAFIRTSHLKSLRFSAWDSMWCLSLDSTVKLFQQRKQRNGRWALMTAARRRTEMRRPCDSVTWATRDDVTSNLDSHDGQVNNDVASVGNVSSGINVASTLLTTFSSTKFSKKVCYQTENNWRAFRFKTREGFQNFNS